MNIQINRLNELLDQIVLWMKECETKSVKITQKEKERVKNIFQRLLEFKQLTNEESKALLSNPNYKLHELKQCKFCTAKVVNLKKHLKKCKNKPESNPYIKIVSTAFESNRRKH